MHHYGETAGRRNQNNMRPNLETTKQINESKDSTQKFCFGSLRSLVCFDPSALLYSLLAGLFLLPSALLADCELRPNEVAIFFPTVAVWDAGLQAWQVDIHGWIYEPETRSVRRRMLLSMLRHSLGISEHDAAAATFRSRAQPFLVENVQRALEIDLAGTRQALPVSDAGGHILARFLVKDLTPNQSYRFHIAACPGAQGEITGEVWAAAPQGRIVISDIDDTIKRTEVNDRRRMMATTFVEEYQAIPGMAGVFSAWRQQDPGTLFYYVSASPWQLFSPLSDFLKRSGFPDGIFSLKRFRWKDRSFMSLWESPAEYKIPLLRALFTQFPERKFILVGDNGEQDPEIYGELAREHVSQVEHIYIRRTIASRTERLDRAFQGLPADLWTEFQDAKDMHP
jgi:hypothetical protein